MKNETEEDRSEARVEIEIGTDDRNTPEYEYSSKIENQIEPRAQQSEHKHAERNNVGTGRLQL